MHVNTLVCFRLRVFLWCFCCTEIFFRLLQVCPAAHGGIDPPCCPETDTSVGHDSAHMSLLEWTARLKPVTLVQAEEDDDDEDWEYSNSLEDEDEMPTFNIPHFRFIDDDDDEDEDDYYIVNRQRWSGSCSTCSSSDEEYPCDSSSSALSDRYVVVSGTPHKILEHLLSDLRLDEHQGATEGKEAGE